MSLFVVLTLALVVLSSVFIFLRNREKDSLGISKTELLDNENDGDPGLLKKHTVYKSVEVPTMNLVYNRIRIFYRPHPQGDKLPKTPTPIPLLVFIHGLGGSVSQFHPLLTSLVNNASCLGIDLPGCGQSGFQPVSWEAYTPRALVQLIAEIINMHCDFKSGQGIVLIGHSMGCSLAALLASSTSPYAELVSSRVLGFVAISPKALPPSLEEAAMARKLLTIPGFIFDLWRRYDRRGGTESPSVIRFTGPGAEEETKAMQYRFNEQSKTAVWRRMAHGLLPDYTTGSAIGGMPGKSVWEGLKSPLFLVGGEADKVTTADNVSKILEFLGQSTILESESHIIEGKKDSDGIDSTKLPTFEPPMPLKDLKGEPGDKPGKPVKAMIFPSPASHALLYAATTSRILAGLIQDFLSGNVDERLSLGWQLQYLTTEGKWDVKNLAKWQTIATVSSPIGGIFRAMKTLREVDIIHTPKVFASEWNRKIYAIIDISHENPVYDPKGLEAGGIQYHKFPTVSKLPPTIEEVRNFITLVDRVRLQHDQEEGAEDLRVIGVHCHYGFNRTGFLIVSYLIERLDYALEDAVEEFRKHRPPGIRHDHFVGTLFVRYGAALKRQSAQQ